MSPPLSREDLEAIAKIVDRRIEERTKPLAARVDKHSSKLTEVREEISPAVARRFSESQHDIEDRSLGFERLVMDSLAATRAEVAAVAKSIPPAASAAAGAEAAAVAGAQASVRAEGKTDAVQIAANRAETQSLAARINSSRALIVSIILILWQVVQALLHVVRP